MIPLLLPGRYALVLTVATVADAPWFPPVHGGSTSTVLVDLARDGEGFVQTGRVCRVDVDGSGIARIEVPPAFLAAIPVRRAPAEVRDGRYRVDLGEDVVGFAPSGPGEPLPTHLGGTVDWDGDGRPAATILLHIPALGRAELYVVQAARVVLDGAVADGGAAGGVDVLRFDQATLAARPGWLAARTRIAVDEARSGFRLLPVAPDADCDAVLAAASAAP